MSDEPPPPSDEDYYASETSEGHPGDGYPNAATVDEHPRHDVDCSPPIVRGEVVGATVNAPPAPQRRTAAVDTQQIDHVVTPLRDLLRPLRFQAPT